MTSLEAFKAFLHLGGLSLVFERDPRVPHEAFCVALCSGSQWLSLHPVEWYKGGNETPGARSCTVFLGREGTFTLRRGTPVGLELGSRWRKGKVAPLEPPSRGG